MGEQKNFKHFIHIVSLSLVASCTWTGTPSLEVSDSAKTVKSAPRALELSFEKGQLLSLISFVPMPGEEAALARKAYTQQAFGLGREFGLKPAGSLPVAAVAVGTYSPAAISFFSWPDALAEERFRLQPQWPAIRSTRPDGWDELRVHDVVLAGDLTLRFDPAKTYTMATAWINPENPEDYDRYLANIEETVNRVGGRFFYQMREPRYVSMAAGRGAPGRITFVEWNSPKGLARFQESAGFKANVHYLRSGTAAFELVVLGPPSS